MAKVQSSNYMRCFLALDLTDRLGKITCPVLALNGTKDRQVNSEENLNTLMDRLAGQKEIKAIEKDSITCSSTATQAIRANI